MAIRLTVMGFVMFAGVGCAGLDARPVDYSVQSWPEADRRSALDRAEQALADLGYTVARRDPATGVIRTDPITIGSGGRRSVRADNPRQKIAEVRLTGEGAAARVHCKVVIQEQAYDQFRMMAMTPYRDDLPGHQTAIDRDAATTAEQNALWRTVRRDRVAEREILDRIIAAEPMP